MFSMLHVGAHAPERFFTCPTQTSPRAPHPTPPPAHAHNPLLRPAWNPAPQAHALFEEGARPAGLQGGDQQSGAGRRRPTCVARHCPARHLASFLPCLLWLDAQACSHFQCCCSLLLRISRLSFLPALTLTIHRLLTCLCCFMPAVVHKKLLQRTNASLPSLLSALDPTCLRLGLNGHHTPELHAMPSKQGESRSAANADAVCL